MTDPTSDDGAGGIAVVAVEQLEFAYPQSEFALAIERLEVSPGEKVAFIGPSGSGKTTLLHLMAGILTADAGSVRVLGEELGRLSDKGRRQLRLDRLGLVFQEFSLVEYLDVVENVLLPSRMNPRVRCDAALRRQAAELAAAVGLERRLKSFPARLSHGERQRVAICRALLHDPPVLLADEPTGNLDPDNKQRILRRLVGECDRRRAALVLVTHDHQLLQAFDRVIDFQSFAAS